jgi:hypothetical protein
MDGPAGLRGWAERLGVIEPDPEAARIRAEERRHMLAALGVDDPGTDELRQKCDRLTGELKSLQPMRIATSGAREGARRCPSACPTALRAAWVAYERHQRH